MAASAVLLCRIAMGLEHIDNGCGIGIYIPT